MFLIETDKYPNQFFLLGDALAGHTLARLCSRRPLFLFGYPFQWYESLKSSSILVALHTRIFDWINWTWNRWRICDGVGVIRIRRSILKRKASLSTRRWTHRPRQLYKILIWFNWRPYHVFVTPTLHRAVQRMEPTTSNFKVGWAEN